jgi:hypothetical protein
MSPKPERPSDADFYERDRVELFSQGDLFRDMPLAYRCRRTSSSSRRGAAVGAS